MFVDKFGRYRNSGGSDSLGGGKVGPPGIGFKLLPTGDYDLSFRILSNVRDPVLAQDAVNLGTLESWTRQSLKKNNGGSYDAGGSTIGNLGEPKDSGDAVNLGTIRDSCVMLSAEKTVSVGDRQIIKVRDPTDPRHAANKRYVDSVVPTKSTSYWGFGKRRLVSIADPVDGQDAVTKAFLMTSCPKSDESGWDFANKRLMFVNSPEDATDGVNKKYCNELENRFKKEISGLTSSQGQWVVSLSEGISNLNNENNRLRALLWEHKLETERQIRKFGQLLFPRIRDRSNNNNNLHTTDPTTDVSAGDAMVTADNYINWDEVFSRSVG